MEAHHAIVSAISARVKSFHSEQRPFRIYHGSTNSTRRSPRRADNTVDTSELKHILAIDRSKRTALVEPNVSMEELLDASLEHGLMPFVVMEFPGITVGGGFSGTSGESSSFRYGAFDAHIASIEIVLGDGSVVRASKRERPDLLWGAASAFGTLGVVTLLEVELREARAYVRLEYVMSGSAEETVEVVERECERGENDFVDGIAFSAEEAVVCVGRMVDGVPEGRTPVGFLGRGDPWFYTHVDGLRGELVRRKKERAHDEQGHHHRRHHHQQQEEHDHQGDGEKRLADYVPLKDYLFRYDRGGFWVQKYAFSYFYVPLNRITRWLLDPVMRARELFRGMHKCGLLDLYMVQDVGVPMARAAEFQRWLDAEMGIYPLWVCPLRVRREGPDSGHGLHAGFAGPGGEEEGEEEVPDLMNFGIWGPLEGGDGGRQRAVVVQRNRALEKKVQELGGMKWLYAQAFYTEDEFWASYDRASYDALRARYGAGYLPSVYDKVRVDVGAEERARRERGFWERVGDGVMGVWPIAGLRGVWYALVGGEYLLRS